MRNHRQLGRRRIVVAAVLGFGIIGGAALAASADGGMTISPSSGPEGSAYDVKVTCGVAPLVKARNLQDSYVQGTIGAFPADDQVSPSVWALHETAGKTDEEYSATCEGVEAGTGRFDAEAPHLWFGPRPSFIGGDRDPRTTVEGTDCPAGTTASVSITSGGKTTVTDAPIDQYGDWTVALPSPVGSALMTIDASCGSVTYDQLQATTTSTSTPVDTVPATLPPSTDPTPATPQPGNADFTG